MVDFVTKKKKILFVPRKKDLFFFCRINHSFSFRKKLCSRKQLKQIENMLWLQESIHRI